MTPDTLLAADLAVARLGLDKLSSGVRRMERVDAAPGEGRCELQLDIGVIRQGYRWASRHAARSTEAAALCVDYAVLAARALLPWLGADELIAWMSTSFELVKSLGRRQDGITLLLGRSQARAQRGDYRRAAGDALQACRSARAIRDRAAEGRALGMLGELCVRRGSFRRACQLYAGYGRCAHAAGDARAEAEALRNLGSVIDELGDKASALAIYDAALSAARQVGDLRVEGQVLNNLGILYKYEGRIDEAVACYEAYLAWGRRTGDPLAQGRALNNIGLAYVQRRKYEDAMACFEQALELRSAASDLDGIATTRGCMGIACKNLGQYDRALEHYHEWVAASRRLGDREGESKALGNLGNLYVRLERSAEAVEILQAAIALDREVGNRQSEGIDLHNLANALVELGEIDRAYPLLEEALAIHRDVRNVPASAATLGKLAKLDAARAEPTRALNRYQAARAILRATKDQHGEADMLASMAEIEAGAGNLSAAVDLAREAGAGYDALQRTEEAAALARDVEEWQARLDAGSAVASSPAAKADAAQPSPHRFLTHAEILVLHEAAIRARLVDRRNALLVGVDPAIRAALPSAATPGTQILSDLDALNDGGWPGAPLVAWVANAAALGRPHLETEHFERTLARLRPSPARETGALTKLRRHTIAAKSDAGVVVVEQPGDLLGSVSLDEVYVERSIEKGLLDDLRDGARRAPILLLGEPGAGKTSLLWHLHELLRINPRCEPWLLKASSVPSLDVGLIEQAIDEAVQLGLEPVVLLDTIDLLLHTEHERDTLHILVQAITERGSRVVMACRPREAQSLPRELRGRPHPVLGDYQEEELSRAIDGHVQRFYARHEVREREEHRARIAALVSARHSLREICAHPLTLRMLFELYAPLEIPSEIDVAGLYDDFWNKRVQTDVRAGMCIAPVDTPDLRGAAGSLAVTMLAEGVVALSLDRAERVLAEEGLPRGQVEDLLRRGVLHASETGAEFFHQTFFEHAAARGIVTSLGASGLDLLRAHVEAQPDDLLAVAVLEQAMIVGADGDPSVRIAAETVFERLLGSLHPTQSGAAIAVYARLRRVSASTIEQASRAMGSPLVADRFLAKIASIPEKRREETFAHLGAIWARSIESLGQAGRWGNCEHLLDELPRLAMRPGDSRFVRELLDAFDILEVVSRLGPGSTGRRKLLVVLAALAPHDTTRVWEDLMKLARGGPGHAPTPELTDLLLRTISRQATVFGRLHIAAELEAEVALDPQRFTTEVSRSLGLVWFAQWRLALTPTSEVLRDIDGTRDERRFRGRLNGLRELLRGRGRADVAAAWAHFEREVEMPRSSEWIRVVWQELLSPPGSSGGTTANAEVLEEAGTRIAAVLAAPPVKGKDGLRVQLVRAARDTGLPEVVARPLLTDPRANEEVRWHALRDLGPLVAFASLRRHPCALEAIQNIAKGSVKHDDQVARLAVTALAPLVAAPPEGRDLFFRLALKVRDVTSLLRALDAERDGPEQAVGQHAEALDALAGKLMSSHHDVERRGGTRLRIELVRRGLAPRPAGAAIEAIAQRLEHDGDGPTRAWLATLLGEADGSAVDHVIGLLLGSLRATAFARARTTPVPEDEQPAGHEELEEGSAVEAKTDDYCEKALAAVIRLSCSHGVVDRWALPIFHLLVYLPTNSGVIRQIGWLVIELCERRVDTATLLVEQLLTSPQVAALGHSGLRSLRATLRRPMRVWIRACDAEPRLRVLSLASTIPPDMSSLVIDAACREVFGEVEAKLRAMLIDPEVPEPVRAYLGRQLDLRRDIPRGGGWPELLAAWRANQLRKGV